MKTLWRAIRKIQSTLLLGMIYAVVIVPAGLLRRWLSGTPADNRESYFVECPADYDPAARMDQPF